MKQYLTDEQSLELRALSYPARTHFLPQAPYNVKVPVFVYSLGDLLEFLPKTYYNCRLRLSETRYGWRCSYAVATEEYGAKELIDALLLLLKKVRPNGYIK